MVVAAEVEKGATSVDFGGHDFAYEDCVVTGDVTGYNFACELDESVFENGNACGRPAKFDAQSAFFVFVLFGLREVLRDFILIFLQNADAEAFLLLQDCEHAGAMVDADQYKRRIERDRSERTGRHAVHFARGAFCGDDGDSASKLA